MQLPWQSYGRIAYSAASRRFGYEMCSGIYAHRQLWRLVLVLAAKTQSVDGVIVSEASTGPAS